VVLDNVQFEKNSFINRNKLRTKAGWCWLTVPVKTSGRFGNLLIKDVEIANEKRWAGKHWNTIRLNYAKTPFFAEHASFFEATFAREWTSLTGLLRHVTEYLLDAFGITTTCCLASDLKVRGKKDELVLNICHELGATVYLSGPLGKDYLNEDLFQAHGISIKYHDYHHPIYAQACAGFEPYMGAFDLLFNAGPASLGIIRQPQQELVSQ
jgi:hypothetical protein